MTDGFELAPRKRALMFSGHLKIYADASLAQNRKLSKSGLIQIWHVLKPPELYLVQLTGG